MALLLFPTLLGSEWPTGQADCPCVDPWSHANSSIQLNEHLPPTGAGTDCAFTRSDDRVCYGASYGASLCAAHDAALRPGDTVLAGPQLAPPASWG